jgi:hypothetical protein
MSATIIPIRDEFDCAKPDKCAFPRCPCGIEGAANAIIAEQGSDIATAHAALLAVRRYKMLLPVHVMDQVESAIALIEGVE